MQICLKEILHFAEQKKIAIGSQSDFYTMQPDNSSATTYHLVVIILTDENFHTFREGVLYT